MSRKFNKLKIFMVILVSVFAVLSMWSAPRGLTDLQREHLRQKVRITQRDTVTIPGSVITHYCRGTSTWTTTNRLTLVMAPASLRISKLKLIVNLKNADKWITVKGFIQQRDLWDEWNACQFIDTSYPAYISATNEAVKAGLATVEEIDRVVRMSVDQ